MAELLAVETALFFGGRRIRPIFKSEFAKSKIVRWAFSRVGGIPVERGTADMKCLRAAQHALQRGEDVLIFPEGTRTRAGVPMKLKRGVAHAALRTGCRLAVVHIRSSHAWLNKDTQWYEIPAVRPSIRLTFEGMIDPKDYLREGEDGYSLASRRLTEAMRRELLKAAGREDEIEGKARGRRQN